MGGRTAMGATIIATPSSNNNQDGKRYLQMHQATKGNQLIWNKVHIMVDDASGLVHYVECIRPALRDHAGTQTIARRDEAVSGETVHIGLQSCEMASKHKLRYLIAENPLKLKQVESKREMM